MTIDWITPLAAIDGDDTSIAVTIRGKVTALGSLYDANGHPDVMHESAEHLAWRAALASELAVRDRAAASVDGKPLTTIDPADPGASRAVVDARLKAAKASGTVAVLIEDLTRASLPVEPRPWVDAYYVRPPSYVTLPASPQLAVQVMGDIESQLLAALDELAAYVSFL